MLNKEVVAEAHEIIDGIPEKAIRLSLWLTKRGQSLDCGTIACGAGWLSMHPKFMARGAGTYDEEIFSRLGYISDKALLLERLKRAYYEQEQG